MVITRLLLAFSLCTLGLYPAPAAAQHVSPTNIANCVLWLRADADSVLTNTHGRVSQWRDLSGRGHHAFQDDPLFQARYETDVINGLPAVRFDGVDDFLTIAHHDDLEAGNGLTVFFVCERTNGFRMMQKGNGPGTDRNSWFISPAPVMGVAGIWNTGVPYTSGWGIREGVFDREIGAHGRITTHTNGVQTDFRVDLSAAYLGNTDPLTIGKRVNPAGTEGHFEGRLTEVIVFNRALAETERKEVGLYLEQRYAIPGSYSDLNDEAAAPPWISQVAFSPASSGVYLGSPALIILPNGDYLVSYDLFGNQAPANANGMFNASVLARSTDKGLTWTAHTQGTGFFWASFFFVSDTLYRMGSSARFESIAIASSTDNGHTWTTPVTLVTGGNGTTAPNYTTAPVPVAFANGRIYRAFENMDPLVFASGMRALVMSAPVDSDLLDPASWTASNELPFDTAWFSGVSGIHTPSNYGYLEGNVVVGPDGRLWDILASNRRSSYDKAVILSVSADGTNVAFERYIDLPGGGSKFTIRRDPVTGLYLMMGNNITDRNYVNQRNVLSLSASPDLINWTHVTTLITDNQPISWEESVEKTGFQYADWRIEGDDIIYLVRTAYDGAANFHDSNRITFHRLKNYVNVLHNRREPGFVLLIK